MTMRPRAVIAALGAIALVAGCGGVGPDSRSPAPSVAAPIVLSASQGLATASAGTSLTAALTPDPVGDEPFTPNDLAFGPDGTLYASDCGGGRVFRVDADKAPVSVVGLGSEFQPFDGDGRPAWAAHLQCPWGIAFDAQGRLQVVDHGHGRVRRVEDDGSIRTIAGGGAASGTPAERAELSEPQSIAVDGVGNLYVSDRLDRVIRVDPAGGFTVVAGTGSRGFSGDGGPAVEAQLDNPAGIALDDAGGIYVADTYNNRVRYIDPKGVIRTVAGNGEPASSGDGGEGVQASIAEPYSVLLDAAGGLVIGETGEDRAFRFGGQGNRYRVLGVDGRIRPFAGTGEVGRAGDGGSAAIALLNAYDSGMGLAMDPQGRIYLADAGNHAIRVVDPDGTISTFVSAAATG